jgi:hypothetical protein
MSVPNIIRSDSTTDEASQLNSEGDSLELRSMNGGSAMSTDARKSIAVVTFKDEAMVIPKLPEETDSKSFQQMVYSKASKLYPAG